MKELGRRIKKRRERLGMTQKALAGRVGRSHPWLVDLEQGRGNPPAEIITALAVELGEDPREYLRLAGRVALTAAEVVPVSPVQPEIASAIDKIVRDRTDALLRVVQDALSEIRELRAEQRALNTVLTDLGVDRAALQAALERERGGAPAPLDTPAQ